MGRICKKQQVNFIVYSAWLCKNSHNGLHLRQFFLLALFLIFLFFNYVLSVRPHLIFSSQYEALSTNSAQSERRQERKAAYKLNQAQISLRRDICSETISQVVICGIIASPTHKCMGVCMCYARESVCVWHTVVPGVSA